MVMDLHGNDIDVIILMILWHLLCVKELMMKYLVMGEVGPMFFFVVV